MTNPYLLPLALLYVDNRREEDGVTRFQKLAFLAQEETELGQLFQFQEHKYGPFSKELYGALDELESRDLVRREKRSTRGGNEKIIYTITGRGQQVIKRHLDDGDENVDDVFEAANEIKRAYNDEPLERLLEYVYNKYPRYTGESEILTDEGDVDLSRSNTTD